MELLWLGWNEVACGSSVENLRWFLWMNLPVQLELSALQGFDEPFCLMILLTGYGLLLSWNFKCPLIRWALLSNGKDVCVCTRLVYISFPKLYWFSSPVTSLELLGKFFRRIRKMTVKSLNIKQFFMNKKVFWVNTMVISHFQAGNAMSCWGVRYEFATMHSVESATERTPF